MKYTAHQLKRSLIETDKDFLETFKVNKYDRDYQIWKRKPLSVDLLTEELFKQKLEYIHYNLSAGRQVLYSRVMQITRRILLFISKILF
ncbi:MAG: hypothetical protein M3R50_01845 [Bacteroidota bacterium]|nr:hypothetical protein [Bacteroidota bacterium]